jgi:hypothetical protein
MTWRAARSLPVLHAQLKAGTRAAPPATPAGAWGLVGDTSHTSTSDHSPKDFPGWGDGIVTAADFPDRPDLGLDARQVLDTIRRWRDSRVKYGISHGQMFSSYPTSSYPAWTWRPYNGSDGHWTHGHLSVVGDARADGEQPWATGLEADDMFSDTDRKSLTDIRTTLGSLIQGLDKTVPQSDGKTYPIAVNALLKSIAGRVDIDPAELAAIEAAAKAGAAAAADDIVARVLSGLPAHVESDGGGLTREDVEQAVRAAFAGGLAPDA